MEILFFFIALLVIGLLVAGIGSFFETVEIRSPDGKLRWPKPLAKVEEELDD